MPAQEVTSPRSSSAAGWPGIAKSTPNAARLESANSRGGLLNFLEDPLHLVELILQFVDPDAQVGEPEVDMLVRGDRHVAQPPVLVGEAAGFLARCQRRLRRSHSCAVEGPGADYNRHGDEQHLKRPGGRVHDRTSASASLSI